jgi:hypothetical protein
MAIIGGMDTGYGSQAKLIRTNFLVTRSADSALTASHNTGLSNFLTLANNRLPKNLQCDYIFVASSDSNSGVNITSPVIATHENKGKVSLMGLSTNSLANASGLEGHANTSVKLGEKSNGIIHQVVSIGAVKLTADGTSDTFDTVATVVLNPIGSNNIPMLDVINGELIKDQFLEELNAASTVDLTNVIDDVDSEASTIQYPRPVFTTSFIPEGNTAGLTPTTFDSPFINNKVWVVLSVTALIQTAQ